MSAYATVADLASRWRPLSTLESDMASVLLDDAADIINQRVDASQSAPALLKIVSCNMVRRAMEAHKDALGFESDDATAWNPITPVGGLRLYDTEAALLMGTGSGALYSVRASR